MMIIFCMSKGVSHSYERVNTVCNKCKYAITATCPNLTLTNGMISYNPDTIPRLEGTVATHSCDVGYGLSGGSVRTCQSDRIWSGGSITCEGNDAHGFSTYM